ncbi:branched-chain amino acid transport system II carrier protein [Tuberibacillus sp. Marseille-P3662]|uniref:branched-chain amino acid transport system II carrier protein n=1 Tax=Tuberibacillus sp. Marseille-P3662 TaxID=1965358 RepID=UPI000A1CBC19|nr:branched-chain amino acid transport system II carrier protein [Tuberibacillus sp. Marseille-P3662]
MKQTNFNTLKLGLMMLALFLGAGNLIFPPKLGLTSGEHLWPAIIGFLITGVGLPLLGVTAVAVTGNSLRDLAGRAHPIFGIMFTVVIYLAIGPLFGIPRTGSVAYEIGIAPFAQDFIPNTDALLIFSIIFFGLTLWLSLKPGKMVDRFGKIITPILVIVIATIVIVGFLQINGQTGQAAAPYDSEPFYGGFIQGYLTLDAIAALVFGIVITSTIKSQGTTDHKTVTKVTLKAGMIAVTGLGLIYLSLAYLGANTVNQLGAGASGGDILTFIANTTLGQIGQILLGIAIGLACLTTAVGLVTSCSSFLQQLLPKLPYPVIATLLSLFSGLMANLGLTQLIAVMTPILLAIYPMAITLMILCFTHRLFSGFHEVYAGALIGTGIISILDALSGYGISLGVLQDALALLPLYEQSMGWIVPAFIFGLVGWIIGYVRKDAQDMQHEYS